MRSSAVFWGTMIGASSSGPVLAALAFRLVWPDFVPRDENEDEGVASVRGSSGAREKCTASCGSDPSDALPDMEEEPAFVEIVGLPITLVGDGTAVID